MFKIYTLVPGILRSTEHGVRLCGIVRGYFLIFQTIFIKGKTWNNFSNKLVVLQTYFNTCYIYISLNSFYLLIFFLVSLPVHPICIVETQSFITKCQPKVVY